MSLTMEVLNTLGKKFPFIMEVHKDLMNEFMSNPDMTASVLFMIRHGRLTEHEVVELLRLPKRARNFAKYLYTTLDWLRALFASMDTEISFPPLTSQFVTFLNTAGISEMLKQVSPKEFAVDFYVLMCRFFSENVQFLLDAMLVSFWGQYPPLEGSVSHHALKLIVSDWKRFRGDPVAFLKYLSICKILYDEPQTRQFVKNTLKNISRGPKGFAKILKATLKIRVQLSEPDADEESINFVQLMQNFKCAHIFTMAKEQLELLNPIGESEDDDSAADDSRARDSQKGNDDHGNDGHHHVNSVIQEQENADQLDKVELHDRRDSLKIENGSDDDGVEHLKVESELDAGVEQVGTENDELPFGDSTTNSDNLTDTLLYSGSSLAASESPESARAEERRGSRLATEPRQTRAVVQHRNGHGTTFMIEVQDPPYCQASYPSAEDSSPAEPARLIIPAANLNCQIEAVPVSARFSDNADQLDKAELCDGKDSIKIESGFDDGVKHKHVDVENELDAGMEQVGTENERLPSGGSTANSDNLTETLLSSGILLASSESPKSARAEEERGSRLATEPRQTHAVVQHRNGHGTTFMIEVQDQPYCQASYPLWIPLPPAEDSSPAQPARLIIPAANLNCQIEAVPVSARFSENTDQLDKAELHDESDSLEIEDWNDDGVKGLEVENELDAEVEQVGTENEGLSSGDSTTNSDNLTDTLSSSSNESSGSLLAASESPESARAEEERGTRLATEPRQTRAVVQHRNGHGTTFMIEVQDQDQPYCQTAYPLWIPLPPAEDSSPAQPARLIIPAVNLNRQIEAVPVSARFSENAQGEAASASAGISNHPSQAWGRTLAGPSASGSHLGPLALATFQARAPLGRLRFQTPAPALFAPRHAIQDDSDSDLEIIEVISHPVGPNGE